MQPEVLAAKEVLNQYPKVKQLLLEWQLAEIKKFQQEAVKELGDNVTVPEPPAESVEQMLAMGYAMGPRFLYNFFDDQKLYICIVRAVGGFTYEINGIRHTSFINVDRVATEKAAFLDGFDMLENKK